MARQRDVSILSVIMPRELRARIYELGRQAGTSSSAVAAAILALHLRGQGEQVPEEGAVQGIGVISASVVTSNGE